MGIDSTDRGATPVVGNVLLVAVVIVIGIVLVTLSFSFLEGTGAPSAEASFEYEQTPVGLQMTATAIGTDVTVQLNDRTVATVAAGDAGKSVIVPTAPGDRITVVSQDGEKSVLVDREIDDRDEIGDFIADYTFEAGSGNTLFDRSGNGNDGGLHGDPDWLDSSLAFDGSGDYVEVDQFNTPVDRVEEFTVAVTYRTNDGSAKQELVEHKSNQDNWLLELKPCDNSQVPDNRCEGNDEYVPVFSVDQAGGTQDEQIFGGGEQSGTRQTLVGTFNGTGHTLYVDGARASSGEYEGDSSMGELNVGKDVEFDGDYLDGEVYEIRLYYTAFDDQQVRVLTDAMG
ncbi:LamG-like jellyroll fold domain-containing protein [Halapricum hydrolyticum]|uniref:LamG domain-containing protein n=1 Tax=Halapricum hydrolyticum TaxID=2979991 RepID=A0AAE3IB77_9EURY|nr:LamG-like jellyroll fold domain-containing protein [Halapricum hydrolyticum]MCU4719143.1 LamG domain-containing protein [Halapricum hydrolyticum]MCU4727333.1 LamG domain-containing protein [Halapricum hydrolyticum]